MLLLPESPIRDGNPGNVGLYLVASSLIWALGAAPFPILSDCGKVNWGWVGDEMIRVVVPERWPTDRVVGGIGAAEGSRA